MERSNIIYPSRPVAQECRPDLRQIQNLRRTDPEMASGFAGWRG